MKNVLIAIVLLLIVAAAWFSLFGPEESVPPPALMSEPGEKKMKGRELGDDPRQNISVSRKPSEAQPGSSEEDAARAELLRHTAEQGQEIEDLIQQYQNNLTNPAVRAQLELQIQSKMDAYDAAVLPLAIEKMKESK